MQKNQGKSLFQLLIVETFIIFFFTFWNTYKVFAFIFEVKWRYNVQCHVSSWVFLSAMQIKYFNGMSSSHEIYLYIKSKEYVMSIGRTKKSHNCEEGEAHLRIFAWHLLMNLKHNYLLKTFWSGSIENVRILIFTMYFFKKIKKNTWRYILHLCTKNLDYMIYSS